MPAKLLTKEQKRDAERLSSIFLSRQKESVNLTQESLADSCGWKTQGAVNQYLRGKIPLNLPALLKFSRALRVQPEEISPTLAAEIEGYTLVGKSSQDSTLDVDLLKEALATTYQILQKLDVTLSPEKMAVVTAYWYELWIEAGRTKPSNQEVKRILRLVA